MAEAQIVSRPAARVVVVDAAERVLLMCWEHRMVRSPSGRVWITPGGGVDEGETYEGAALRELREETGITGVPLGPCVWTREHVFDFEQMRLRQIERFFIVRVPDVELTRDGWTEGEQRSVSDVRWWSVNEIATSEEWFAPRRLAELLPALLRDELPREPIDTGP